jgi:diaminopimelate decarboxylase
MGFQKLNDRFILEQSDNIVDLIECYDLGNCPVYVYDIDGLDQRISEFKNVVPPNTEIHYALKANCNKHVLQSIKSQGVGLDVVSGGELKQGLEAGFKASDIVFSGVGKTVNEIELAINEGVKQINVESVQELERICFLSRKLNKPINVAFRMNPDVDAKTHPYITTGFRENKFGMDFLEISNLVEILKNNKNVHLSGLTMHIGSQLRDIKPLEDATKRLLSLWDELISQGHKLETLDLGGGLGIDYKDSTESDLANIQLYGEMLKSLLKDFNGRIILEPGRILVARFGALITKIQYIKENRFKNFAIVDTGMHHLMRPCLYQAYHRIIPLKFDSSHASDEKLYDIVGPICESSDVLGKDRLMGHLRQDDYLAVCDVGAYGHVMANNYNTHGLPIELAYSKGQLLK